MLLCVNVLVHVHMYVCGFPETHSILLSEIGSLIEPDWLASELRDPPVFTHPSNGLIGMR